MRPVDKGESPYETISDYHDAEPFLNDRIGRYCSYCEIPIYHVPEIDHKEGKYSGGELTKWGNLLYSCKYCNTRKSQKIKFGEKDKWIWPDEDNTFIAYTYENGYPKVNEKLLKESVPEVLERAWSLYDGVDLGFVPQKVTDKDKRWAKRMEVYGIAEECKNVWDKLKTTEYRETQINSIITLAKQVGFFSVWMSIFEQEKEIKLQLLQNFPGTAQECFDSDGNVVLDARRNRCTY